MGEERGNLVSWYRKLVFLCSGNEGSLHLYFHQIRYSGFFFPPSWVIFIPARLALRNGGGKGEAAVVKLLWPAWRYFKSATRRFLDFNSCFLIAGNERIYE